MIQWDEKENPEGLKDPRLKRRGKKAAADVCRPELKQARERVNSENAKDQREKREKRKGEILIIAGNINACL